MKILSAEQIRDWDKASMAAEGISSLMLMERAAVACTEWIVNHYKIDTPFLIICGTGNNGGDGLAITRLLIGMGYSAAAFLLQHSKKLSPDCRSNLEALKREAPGTVQMLREGNFITELPATVVIINAIFGIGLNRKPESYVAEFITKLNDLSNAKIAIDLPSGLMADVSAPDTPIVIHAQHTLTFQQYKRSMLHPEGGRFCGKVHVIAIGLDGDFQEHADSSWNTLDQQFVCSMYKPRQSFSNKGTYGTAFLIGGSYGMIGAAVLATKAAARAGAGKVRTLLPSCGYDIMQISAPDAMCTTSGEWILEKITGWESAEGIGIGPGMGKDAATVKAFEQFLKEVDRPIVLDADALNILAEHSDWMELLPKHSILTPHPKEFERMFGKSHDSLARVTLVKEKARELGVIIVAKDTHTFVALPDGRGYYNINGNAGLATGGSGDVLCGMITALLAQGYSPEQAALLGVFLHGAAGDEAAKKTGMEAVIAGDIVENIGNAFLGLVPGR